ncbi:hypothetical protein F4780DRAFT_263363 [Xylariomycetidae sp. FL0641]|nr:hypothetical protein F4780DRAFT_263363 [Xylariomycetidae sp. FL0641]
MASEQTPERDTSTHACVHAPLNPSQVVVDPDGDLYLHVGKTKCLPSAESEYDTSDTGSDTSESEEEEEDEEEEEEEAEEEEDTTDDGSNGDGPDESHETQNQSDQPSNGGHEHEQAVVFRVCSKTMSRASPVWKRLLYGGFAESIKPHNQDWVVYLPEDDPKALATLLNIIHSRFEHVPRVTDAFSLDYLYQLTVFTDKYDLAAVLRPWASTWMKNMRKGYSEWRNTPPSEIPFFDIERRTWVAWEMGDRRLFACMLAELARYCHVDCDGSLQCYIGGESVPLFSRSMAVPGAYDLVQRYRTKHIANILHLLENTVTWLCRRPSDLPTSHSYQCIHGSTQKEQANCDASMLGVMMQSLTHRRLWPLPAASKITTNLVELLRSCSRLKSTSIMVGHDARPCSALVREDLERAGSIDSLELEDVHRAHLETQAKKSGLDS